MYRRAPQIMKARKMMMRATTGFIPFALIHVMDFPSHSQLIFLPSRKLVVSGDLESRVTSLHSHVDFNQLQLACVALTARCI